MTLANQKNKRKFTHKNYIQLQKYHKSIIILLIHTPSQTMSASSDIRLNRIPSRSEDVSDRHGFLACLVTKVFVGVELSCAAKGQAKACFVCEA